MKERLIHSIHEGEILLYKDELWEVVGVYPYHIVIETDHDRQSLSFGELIQMGLETQDDIHEALRKERKDYGEMFRHEKKEVAELDSTLQM